MKPEDTTRTLKINTNFHRTTAQIQQAIADFVQDRTGHYRIELYGASRPPHHRGLLFWLFMTDGVHDLSWDYLPDAEGTKRHVFAFTFSGKPVRVEWRLHESRGRLVPTITTEVL